MFSNHHESNAEDADIEGDVDLLERFIPVTVEDLLDDISTSDKLKAEDAKLFKKICEMFVAIYHAQYHRHILKLKRAYNAFSPDCDTVTPRSVNKSNKKSRLETLVKELTYILDRANFEALSIDDINKAINQISPYGVQVSVDLNEFDEIALFYRGQGIRKFTRRKWKTLFITKEIIEVPLYRRLFVLLKPAQQEGKLNTPVILNSNNVYLKLFKNIPHFDLEMLFPNTKVKMTLFDKVKLSITGGGGTIGGLLTAFGKFSVAVAKGPVAIVIVVGVLLGVIWRQIAKIFTHRTKYMAELTKNLYFYNLNNNMGAISQIVDMAEGEEFKEAILAYYFLFLNKDKNFKQEKLDKTIEAFIEQEYGVSIDFEITDGLQKLESCQLLNRDSSGNLSVVGLKEALKMLNQVWDDMYSV